MTSNSRLIASSDCLEHPDGCSGLLRGRSSLSCVVSVAVGAVLKERLAALMRANAVQRALQLTGATGKGGGGDGGSTRERKEGGGVGGRPWGVEGGRRGRGKCD